MTYAAKIKPLEEWVLKIKRIGAAALDIIFPRDLQHSNKAEDWTSVTYLDNPCCETCGFPFEYDQGPQALCAKCIVQKPVFDKARAAFVYNEKSRGYILAFKHGGRTEYLDMFARQLQRAGREFWPDTDYIIPVPLHPRRLLKRKFNQAALLARRTARYVAIQYCVDILVRRRKTESQGAQTYKGRFRNVRGAFSISDNAKSKIRNKTIVLIDDVMTTGATLEACTRTLKRAGAAKVYVLCLARVVREQEIPT